MVCAVDEDPLLSYRDIANIAGIQPKTVRNYRASGRMPPPDDLDVPDRPRWRESTVRAWLAKRPGQGARTDLQPMSEDGGTEGCVDGTDAR